MPAPPLPPARAARPLRGALVALALAGYVAALAATPAGQGLGLLGHLAGAHAAPAAAPPLVVGTPGGEQPVLPTLRARHRHGGGAAHEHGAHEHGADGHRGHGADGHRGHGADGHRGHSAAPDLHRHTYPVLVHAAPPEPDAARAGREHAGRLPGGAGVHEHDGVPHTHGAPAPEPAVVAPVSLDEHRQPEAPPVPGPPPRAAAPPAPGGVGPAWTSLSVETPPPLGRG
ncbi:hypothetical protein RQM47_03715 [Rubrivirga sp. S365]|uniref:Uncharacterized protein n=1 Tax=Rubrivirga litoralis TaxID=3075598 RepID=A0ABU3BLW0_9BACT|nr:MULTISPECIES: hypothetical protein [unclassified Rubrivirga]MDT0630230.1 hypothetical protein [Rubrivirga sp. F394]MDT7855741.1 hypothetical protein [Rubrivirga sp. S365]